jgi:hypothetical protein
VTFGPLNGDECIDDVYGFSARSRLIKSFADRRTAALFDGHVTLLDSRI